VIVLEHDLNSGLRPEYEFAFNEFVLVLELNEFELNGFALALVLNGFELALEPNEFALVLVLALEPNEFDDIMI
jgi:hypothetical protein